MLRLKEGEIVACTNLTKDAKSFIAPIFVAAPPNDRDPQKRRILTSAELIVESGQRVARAWGHLPCMLDVRFLAKRLGVDSATDWVPEIFAVAARFGANASVVANIADAHGSMLRGYINAVERTASFPTLRLSLTDLQMPELEARLSAVLGAFGAAPKDAVVILDFGGADLSVVEIAADVMVAAYERLASYGIWRKIVMSITSYPEANPAPEGKLVLIARPEVAIWRALAASGSIDRSVAIMGDFGPDSSKFLFKSGGSAPIPHYRYSTLEHWLVVRANKAGTHRDNVLSIANRLVSHKLFMGPDYSMGDRYYSQSATGDVIGGATEWRAANVNHHLQFVARQVGTELGLSIPSLPPMPVQANMFEGIA